MSQARKIAGPSKVISGNIDPTVLYGSNKLITDEVHRCISQAQTGIYIDDSELSNPADTLAINNNNNNKYYEGGFKNHVLNLGHGIEKDTPEESVKAFVDAARCYKAK